MNKVILAGRLATDPEIRYTQSGKAVGTFRLAVNRHYKRNPDSTQPSADFIPIIVWEKLAEICGNNLNKGRQILVEGRMQVRSYEAQDGSKRYVTEVIANEIEFMGSKGEQHPAADKPGADAGESAGEDGSASMFGPVIPEEEIPF